MTYKIGCPITGYNNKKSSKIAAQSPGLPVMNVKL